MSLGIFYIMECTDCNGTYSIQDGALFHKNLGLMPPREFANFMKCDCGGILVAVPKGDDLDDDYNDDLSVFKRIQMDDAVWVDVTKPRIDSVIGGLE